MKVELIYNVAWSLHWLLARLFGGITMRKVLSLLLTFAVLTTCITGCRKHKKGYDELLSPYVFDTDQEMEVISEEDGVKSVYFHRGELKIYGEIYMPEGEGAFPTVVITGGSGSKIDDYKDYAEAYAKSGYVTVLYEGIGSVLVGMSDGKQVDHTLLSHAADLESVIHALQKLDYVDNNNIYLWAHSAGGVSTGFVACKNPDMIAGLILLEPRFMLNEEMKELFPNPKKITESVCPQNMGVAACRELCEYDIYDMLPDYKGDVLLFVGTRSMGPSGSMPQEFSKADEKFPSCELMTIDGADHGFKGPAANAVIESSIPFLEQQVEKRASSTSGN